MRRCWWLSSVVLALVLAGAPRMARAIPACAEAAIGALCACTLSSLHPLQGGIGMGEVNKKKADIQDKPVKELLDLIGDPIRVVRGPDKQFYITDHHHGALAWLKSGVMGDDSFCEVVGFQPSPANEEQFIGVLVALKLVRLRDENGGKVEFDALPKTLVGLHDDPFRTLAWELRKERFWCRNPGHVEFAEFEWADFLRHPVNQPLDDAAMSTLLQEAKNRFAVDSAAKARPGYNETRAKCPEAD